MSKAQDHSHVALVVGVTGMAGIAIAEALKSPTAPGGPWKVYGAARRPKPSWFPPTIVDHFLAFDALNFDDTDSTLSPLSGEITYVFWVAIQVRPNEQENVRLNSLMLSNVLDVLIGKKGDIVGSVDNVSSKLTHVTLQTGTGHYMGPIHSLANWNEINPYDPPFREEVGRLPCPNFYYALEDLVMSYSSHFTYSIHRASIIVGASARSVYNSLLTLAVYAEVCKYVHGPFKYPGTMYTWEHFCDMSDTRVLAEQHVWAAFNERAKNEAFNCTNGDMFTWKQMWGVLCEEFGVEFVPLNESDEGFDLVEEMRGKGPVWDKIVEEKSLVKTKINEITCFGALQNVLRFHFQHVSSMNKSKEFGFFGYADSFKSVRHWVRQLREMKIIP